MSKSNWEFCIALARERLGGAYALLRSRKAKAEAREWTPYVLHQVAPDNQTDWVWLNRYYKPLGEPNGPQVNYEAFPGMIVRRDDPRIAELSARLSGVRMMHLFNDATAPWNSGLDLRAYMTLLNLVDTSEVRA